jgi:hypothetical protein
VYMLEVSAGLRREVGRVEATLAEYVFAQHMRNSPVCQVSLSFPGTDRNSGRVTGWISAALRSWTKEPSSSTSSAKKVSVAARALASLIDNSHDTQALFLSDSSSAHPDTPPFADILLAAIASGAKTLADKHDQSPLPYLLYALSVWLHPQRGLSEAMTARLVSHPTAWNSLLDLVTRSDGVHTQALASYVLCLTAGCVQANAAIQQRFNSHVEPSIERLQSTAIWKASEAASSAVSADPLGCFTTLEESGEDPVLVMLYTPVLRDSIQQAVDRAEHEAAGDSLQSLMPLPLDAAGMVHSIRGTSGPGSPLRTQHTTAQTGVQKSTFETEMADRNQKLEKALKDLRGRYVTREKEEESLLGLLAHYEKLLGVHDDDNTRPEPLQSKIEGDASPPTIVG